MVFCKRSFSPNIRTGALTCSIAPVCMQWVEFLLPFTIFYLEKSYLSIGIFFLIHCHGQVHFMNSIFCLFSGDFHALTNLEEW